jgi:site-specific DNA recombinase
MRLRKKSSYTAAVYLRLSREDGDKAESDSIHNQRELIKEYLTHHPEITNTKEYVDDGFSGTNFERPGFIRMMSDIENHRIDCIIVKDLSRFGRNYIETGKYLDRIFPMLEVRFISINDNYDNIKESDDADQIVIPFKNLINDAYCRDISIKIRSQLDVKRRNGKFVGSFAGYGYKKDPKDRNHLIIDEYAANIVQTIFNMKLQGYSAGTIADYLNEQDVLTPMEYKRSCGMNFNSGFRISTDPVWHPNMVTRILKNEVYTGMTVQGKNRKINYKVKKLQPVEEAEWIRVPGTHEAIVSRDIFDSVQNLLLLETRIAPEKTQVDVFSGLVRCGDCGQNMVRRCVRKKNKKYYYYHCSTYKNGMGCTSHLISAEKLYDVVLMQTQKQIGMLLKAEEVLKAADSLPGEQFHMRALNKQLEELAKEIERYSDLRAKLYQDMSDQVVSREEYKELDNRFSRKIKEAKRVQKEISQKKEHLNLDEILKQDWLKEFEQYRNIQKLERKIVVALIEKIIVYAKDRIEIRFLYMDAMDMMIEAAEFCEKQAEERSVAE